MQLESPDFGRYVATRVSCLPLIEVRCRQLVLGWSRWRVTVIQMVATDRSETKEAD